ncbi:MAG: hypothetical protein ACODAJ_05540 [Planctomycetota bacterium]
MSCPLPTVTFLSLLCALGACVPDPEDDAPPEGTRRVPVSPVPCPADDTALAQWLSPVLGEEAAGGAPAVLRSGPADGAPVADDDEALARGPALRLHSEVLDGEKAVLEKLQDLTAEVEALRREKTELAARLSSGEQAVAAHRAEAEEARRKVARLSEDLKARADTLADAKSALADARATIADLEPRAQKAEEAAAKVAKLTEQLQAARAETEQFRDRALQAELARVKAQQDLVALQIVMARQKALLRGRSKPTEAKAPQPPDTPGQEARP